MESEQCLNSQSEEAIKISKFLNTDYFDISEGYIGAEYPAYEMKSPEFSNPISKKLGTKKVKQQLTVKEDYTAHLSLNMEVEKHNERLTFRTEIFTKILSNETQTFAWQRFILNVMASVSISVVSSFSITLIPVHNVLDSAKYWYEPHLQFFPGM